MNLLFTGLIFVGLIPSARAEASTPHFLSFVDGMNATEIDSSKNLRVTFDVHSIELVLKKDDPKFKEELKLLEESRTEGHRLTVKYRLEDSTIIELTPEK